MLFYPQMIKPFATRKELLSILPKNSYGAEIGVMLGEFSEDILEVVQPSQLDLVDLWQEGTTLQWYERSQFNNRAVLYGVDAHVAHQMVQFKFRDSPNVKIRHMRSDDYLNECQRDGVVLDWVYLDACHDYESVVKELKYCRHVVKRGGYIMGHDYNDLFGVKRAVNWYCATYNATIHAMTNEVPMITPKGTHAFNSFVICNGELPLC